MGVSKYERGTILQRILDPLAGAIKLDNGALFYQVEEKELAPEIRDQEKLRKEFERMTLQNEGVLEGADGEDDLRIALLQDMESNSPFNIDEFQDILDKEFSIFKKENQYDYVRDMKDAFQDSLAKPAAVSILETIPEHAFWDIKVPQTPQEQRYMNPYNPFRKYPFSSFFEHRDYEEYLDRKIKKENL